MGCDFRSFLDSFGGWAAAVACWVLPDIWRSAGLLTRGLACELERRKMEPRVEKRLFLGGSTTGDGACCGFLSVLFLASEISLELLAATTAKGKLPWDEGRLPLLAFEWKEEARLNESMMPLLRFFCGSCGSGCSRGVTTSTEP
jgi:hypothetical protein